MPSIKNNLLITILILPIVKHELVISHPLNRSDADVGITTTRECKPVMECTFYKNILALQKIRTLGLQKSAVMNELEKQNCGWEDDIKPKGNYQIPLLQYIILNICITEHKL